MGEVTNDVKRIELLSAEYDIDKIRTAIKEQGYKPTDDNVLKLAEANIGTPGFNVNFSRSQEEINNEIDEIGRKEYELGMERLPTRYRGKTLTNKYIDYAVDKVVTGIAKTFGIDIDSASDHIDRGKAILNRDDILDESIQTEASYKYNADADWFLNGVKQIDMTGFLSSSREDAERFNEMILPQYDEDGKQTNPWYNERLGQLAQGKFIEYSQSALSQGAEALTGLLAQTPYFIGVGGLTGKAATKAYNFISKAAKVTKVGKNSRFVNALKTVAASNTKAGLKIDYFADALSTSQKAMNVAGHVGHKVISDGLMFAALGVPRGEDIVEGFVDGALFGIASGLGGVAGKSLGALTDSKFLQGVTGLATSGSIFSGGSGLVALHRGAEYGVGDAVKEFVVGAALPLIQNHGKNLMMYGATTTIQQGKVIALNKRSKKSTKAKSKVAADSFNKVLGSVKDKAGVNKILNDLHQQKLADKLNVKEKEIELEPVETAEELTVKDTTEGKLDTGKPIPPNDLENINKIANEDPAKTIPRDKSTPKDLEDAINREEAQGNVPEKAMELLKAEQEAIEESNTTTGEMVRRAFDDGWIEKDPGGNWSVNPDRIVSSIENSQKTLSNTLSVTEQVRKSVRDNAIKRERERTDEVFSGLEEKADMVKEVADLLKFVKERGVLPAEELGKLKAINTTSKTVDQLKDLYAVARVHAYQGHLVLTKRDLSDLRKSFEVFDTSDADKHPGYDNFFRQVTDAYRTLNIKENPVELANKLISMTKDYEYVDDYINAVREDKATLTKGATEEVIDHFVSDPEASQSVRGLYRFAKSFRSYGGKNLKNFIMTFDDGILKEIPIQKIHPAQAGEAVSFLNEIYGEKIMKVKFGTHENRSKDLESVDFAALPHESKVSLIRQARSKGWMPLFTKGADSVMYFGKPHEKITAELDTMGARNLDLDKYFKERLEREIGSKLFTALEKLDKGDWFETKAEYYQHALNNHYYLQDAFGKDYTSNELLKQGGLKNIVDVLKRFQIVASKGGTLSRGELRNFKADLEPEFEGSELPNLMDYSKEALGKFGESLRDRPDMIVKAEERIKELESLEPTDEAGQAIRDTEINALQGVIQAGLETSKQRSLAQRSSDQVKVLVLEDGNNKDVKSDAWKIYGDEFKDMPLESTDGSMLMSHELFDRYKHLMGVGVESTGLKAFWHDVGGAEGGLGFKMGVYRASDKQNAYLKKQGAEVLTFSSVAKYMGDRKVNSIVEADITKLRYVFAEHIDPQFKKNAVPGKRAKPSRVGMNKQLMNAIAIDPKNGQTDKVYEDLTQIWQRNLDEISRESAKALSSPENASAFMDKVMKLEEKREYLETANEDQRLDLQTVQMATSTVDKLLQLMPESYFAQSIPWAKNYVRTALNNYYYNRLSSPQTDGHMSILRESSEYFDTLDDNHMILGDAGRNMGVATGKFKDGNTSYNKLGDVFDAHQIIKGIEVKKDVPIGKQAEWKQIKEKYPEIADDIKYLTPNKISDAMNITIARSPQENISGARSLRLGGFAKNSGMQVRVTKKNMNALGGADTDIDEVATMLMSDKKFLWDYIKEKEDWTQGVDTDAEIQKDAEGLTQSGPESVYDIGSQMGAITNNINGAKNIAKVASLMKVFNIAYAQNVEFVRDLDIKPLAQNSILSSSYVPKSDDVYNIGILGSKNVERLSGGEMVEGTYSNNKSVKQTYDRIYNLLERALEKNPKARLVTTLERGVNEIALQAADKLSMDVLIHENPSMLSAKNRANDYDRLNKVVGDRRVVRAGTARNNDKYKSIVDISNEVWSMDIDAMHNQKDTPVFHAQEYANRTGRGTVDLTTSNFKTSMETVSKETIDQVFKYYLRYAVDSGKYGGMKPWGDVEGEIVGKIFGITDPFDQQLLARKITTPGESKMSLIRETLRAISSNKDPETGEVLSNGKRLELISKYKQTFKDPKTAMEWGIHKTLDQDYSTTRMVDPAKMKETVYNKHSVPEGGFKYFKWLSKYDYRTDAGINKRDINKSEAEIDSFFDVLRPDKKAGETNESRERRWLNKLTEIQKRNRMELITPDEYRETSPLDALPFDISTYELAIKTQLKKNPNLYTNELRILKGISEDMTIKDIHAATSISMWKPMRSAVETQFKGDIKKAHAEMDAIDTTVKALRHEYDAIWRANIGSFKERKALIDDFVQNRLLPSAYLNPGDARTDWFWFRMIDSMGKKIGSTSETPFSSSLDRSTFLMEQMPVSFMKRYAKAADNLITEVSQEKSITTAGIVDPMTWIGMKGAKKIQNLLFKTRNKVDSKTFTNAEKAIDAFLKTYDNLPNVITGNKNAGEWVQSIINRPAEALERIPLTKHEVHLLVDDALYKQSSAKFMKQPTETTWQNMQLKMKKVRMKMFLPVSTMSKISAGRELYENVQRSTTETEFTQAYLKNTHDEINNFLNEHLKVKATENAKEIGRSLNSAEKDILRKQIQNEFRDMVEWEQSGMDRNTVKGTPMENAIRLWEEKDPNLGNESPREHLHNILQASRQMKQEFIMRKMARNASSRRWGSIFLNKPLAEVEKMNALEYYKEVENIVKAGFERSGEQVGTIEQYYPHFTDRTTKNESMKTWIAEDELWEQLYNEDGITKEQFNSIISKVPESAHAQKRSIPRSEQQAQVKEDLDGYLESVLHPWNRLKTMMHGEKALTDLMQQGMNDPEVNTMTKEMNDYMEATLQHSLSGSKSTDPSVWEDVMTGMSNVVFGTVIGLNVPSGIRNFAQKSFALADAGMSISRDSKAWKKGIPLALDAAGQPIRTYEDVSKQWGVEHGLTSHIIADKIEDNIGAYTKIVKLEYQADQARDQIEMIRDQVNQGNITAEDGRVSIKEREQYISKMDRISKNQIARNKALDLTRAYASRTAEANLGALVGAKKVPWSFSEIEKGNRLYSGRLGYYRGYKQSEAEYRRLNEGNIDPVQMDKDAHAKGLEGASALIALTQYEYHSFNTPAFMRTPTQKALFQFKTFTWNWVNMMHKYYGKPISQAVRHGITPESEHMKRAGMMAVITGAMAAADHLLFQGANNFWQTEPVDKAIDLFNLIGGNEDAAYGKGWFGYASTFTGPVFQPAFDALYSVLGTNSNNALFGQKNSWDYNMNKKYGFLSGSGELSQAVGMTWAGPTMSGIYYDIMKEGSKNVGTMLLHRGLGFKPRWYYSSKKKKKKGKAIF